MKYTVIFDACVLYPAPLRDFLLRLAITGLFSAKWTDQIHEEWTRNVIKNRPELKHKLPRTRELMDIAVADALVTNYESNIDNLVLPDKNDRHVLAAAIHCRAQGIVTFNLKDFPNNYLNTFGIEAIHPDNFIENQLDLNQSTIISVAKQHRAALKKPIKTPQEYIDTLAAQGLAVSADRIRSFIDLI